MKGCTGCGLEKPFDEFYRRNSVKDITKAGAYQSQCMECCLARLNGEKKKKEPPPPIRLSGSAKWAATWRGS